MNDNQTYDVCDAIKCKQPFAWPVRQFIGKIRYWIFLNIWCSHLYRPSMRVLHRFNLHYAPPSPMNPQFGQQNHWCQWCGLRGNTWKHDPAAPLSLNR